MQRLCEKVNICQANTKIVINAMHLQDNQNGGGAYAHYISTYGSTGVIAAGEYHFVAIGIPMKVI